MSPPASQTQWYLARDGQQFGPLSEPELAKFIELGHLQPTDLLWREGFPDWRPAMVVFPQHKPATPRPQQPVQQPVRSVHPSHPAPSPAPQRPMREQAPPPRQAARPMQAPHPGPQTARTGPHAAPRAGPGNMVPMRAQPAPYPDPHEEERERRGGGLKRVLVILLLLAALGAAGWYGYPRRASIMEFVTGLASQIPTGLGSLGGDRKGLDIPPFKGFSGPPEAIDSALQETPLWRVLKREFPEWYAERLKEGAALAAQKKDESAIAQQMARALVALRRQNVNAALGASFPQLKAVAATFYDNLVELRKHSTDACFQFISQGEASPVVVSLLQGSSQTATLQAQLTAVFEAVADGRKAARVYPQPRKSDYDALQADLTGKRGWTQADMQLFSDERALARAGPEKVCQLVHDWFAAQLAVKDPDMQLRLLVDSLKPVVAG